jgi:predicted dithiol-disulfide oxidoreductase (DUF899 family)
MNAPNIVSQAEWLVARRALLAKEKEFTRARDALSAERRAMPWVRVEKSYVFETPHGRRTLAELFDGRSQLAVYHFMYGPDAKSPCKSCSFWADNFNLIALHLAARDVTFTAVSRAPLEKIEALKARMGWRMPWVSSGDSDFNYDFDVSNRPGEPAEGVLNYNFGTQRFSGADAPGASIFAKDGDGAVCRVYSAYSRGLDMLNGAYHWLDLTPKGRDEDALQWPMQWLRMRDEYGA